VFAKRVRHMRSRSRNFAFVAKLIEIEKAKVVLQCMIYGQAAPDISEWRSEEEIQRELL